jgi:hypothetical protein
MQCHVTGVIVHGYKTYHFVDLMQYSHDSNLMLNCLLFAMQQHRPWPMNLKIQLDNCGKENKNIYVMTFMAMLVKRGFFKHVSCLHIGIRNEHDKNY